MPMRISSHLMTVLVLLVWGCTGSDPAPTPAPETQPDAGAEPTDDPCVPSRSMYETAAQRMLAEYCGACHGAEPTFGAPFSLTDYDDLIAGEVGLRKVDRMVARMADKTMPPPGATQVPHFELDTLVGWASCGLVHPDESIGLKVSAPIFDAPSEPPPDTETLDLRAPQFSVSPSTLDLYQCFTFEVPFDSDRFLRRIEVLVDEARVLHHMVLLRDVEQEAPLTPHVCNGMTPESEYLYAWAPGGGPVQFPDGGLRIKPGDRFVMQIHYNNGAGLEDIQDSSGLRLYHSEPDGVEYGMFAPGPRDFALPGETETRVQSLCQITEQTTVLAGMPHMHEIGRDFRQEVIHRDGSQEVIVDLTGWSFESQFFYETPMTLQPGDTLLTTCTFDNPGIEPVASGNGTSDEMCFNFMYVTPPPSARYCDDTGGGQEPEFTPGACFPEAAAEALDDTPSLLESAVQFGSAPPLTGGTLQDGLWLLTDAELWIESPETPMGMLSPASEIEAAGVVFMEGDRLALEVLALLELSFANGDELEEGFAHSVAGTVAPEGDALNLSADCGEDPAGLRFEAQGDRLTVRFSPGADETQTVSLIFERQGE